MIISLDIDSMFDYFLTYYKGESLDDYLMLNHTRTVEQIWMKFGTEID